MLIIFCPSKTLLKSSQSCGCEIFRVLEYLLSIFQLYTNPCHMILSKQMCCLLLNGVSTESQKLTCVRQTRRDYSPTRNMTRIHVGLALSYFSHVQFDSMVYQQIVGIPMCTNCAPLIADLFPYCYDNIHSSVYDKRVDFLWSIRGSC